MKPAAFWLWGLLLGCASGSGEPSGAAEVDLPAVHKHPWYTRVHHAPQGGGPFRNLDPPLKRPFWRSASWILRRIFAHRAHPPTPFRALRPEALRVPDGTPALFWLGHSTVLVRLDTLWVITDPVFSRRVGPVSFAGPVRQVAPPISPEALPRVHVVLISHNHYDHLDKASVRELERRFRPLFLVPLGVGRHLRAWGLRRVLELDWWEYVDYGPLRLHCTPARHFSNRWITDRNRDLWASWYLEDRSGFRLYFGGDTGYGSHFRQIGQLLGAPEVAVLPIGAYEPRWFMQEIHVNPEEAVRALQDLGARYLVPVHWGTFDQADEPLLEPPERLLAAARNAGIPETQLHLLPVGGSVLWTARTP
ncbi:MAG: MBL fold metallo-hydrolase [Bacteroidota bacterium]|nr:MBL fold metallo-hydrolase [Bacteroidota bacterium]MDW8138583.1 MBL fold metallo-hydrolase [Bacteroidota bacterium]